MSCLPQVATSHCVGMPQCPPVDGNCLVCREGGGDVAAPGGFPWQDERPSLSICQRSKRSAIRRPYRATLLVVTQRHVARRGDLTEGGGAMIDPAAARLARALIEVCGAESVYSEAIAIHVRHFHLHLLPRYPGTPHAVASHAVDEWEGAQHGGADETAEVARLPTTSLAKIAPESTNAWALQETLALPPFRDAQPLGFSASSIPYHDPRVAGTMGTRPMTIREVPGRVRRTNTVLSPALRPEVRGSLPPRAPWAARFAKPSRTVSEAPSGALPRLTTAGRSAGAPIPLQRATSTRGELLPGSEAGFYSPGCADHGARLG